MSLSEIIQSILKGFAMGLLLVISVGPVVFTIIKQSLDNGKEGGFSFIIGVWVSDIILIVVCNLFSEFVTTLLNFKKPIGIGGSILLVSMGIYYLFFKKVHVHPKDLTTKGLQGSDHAKIAFQGFLVNVLNPGVIAFWLTTVTAIAVTHTIKERIIIFVTCLGVNMSSDIGKVILAHKLRSKLTIKNIRLIDKITGLILLSFGALLFGGLVFFMKNHS